MVVSSAWEGGEAAVTVEGAERPASPTVGKEGSAEEAATGSAAAAQAVSASAVEAAPSANTSASSSGASANGAHPDAASASSAGAGVTKPVEALTIKELKVILKGLGLGVSGRKSELVQRLNEALAQ